MQTVTKVSKEGAVAGVFGPITVPECAAVLSVAERLRPYLRGLDVGCNGSVYVAAGGSGAVLKISPSGTLPRLGTTAAALLEVICANGRNPRDWLPRVRTLRVPIGLV